MISIVSVVISSQGKVEWKNHHSVVIPSQGKVKWKDYHSVVWF